MVHADASNFSCSSTKEQVYAQILEQAEALFADEGNWVANLANTASLLWHGLKSLPSPSSRVNWAGFYVLDKRDTGCLILGPFHGKVACQRIKIGKGVCGTAVKTRKTQLVKNVHDFADHIACDSETNSEIVVPVIHNDRVVAVIDLDCEVLAGYDEVDQLYLEKLATLLAHACDWSTDS